MPVNPLAARAFGAAAEDYERGRPGWPAGALAGLLAPYAPDPVVLDLAAGTGKLTETLATLTRDVIAVEPVEGMRRVLERRLPGVRVLDGAAEAIPLGDGSVDGAFVAEAFHWFDHPRAVAELARVLRPGGLLALLWNERGWEELGWFADLHAVVMEHRLPEAGNLLRESVPWREAVEADGRFGPLRDETADNPHDTDREGMLALIASFSSIAGLPDDRRAVALAAARDLLERHGVGAVTLPYQTAITTTTRTDG